MDLQHQTVCKHRTISFDKHSVTVATCTPGKITRVVACTMYDFVTFYLDLNSLISLMHSRLISVDWAIS